MNFNEYLETFITESIADLLNAGFIIEDMKKETWLDIATFSGYKISLAKDKGRTNYVVLSQNSQIGNLRNDAELKEFVDFYNIVSHIKSVMKLSDSKIVLTESRGNYHPEFSIAFKGSMRNGISLTMGKTAGTYTIWYDKFNNVEFDDKEILEVLKYLKKYMTGKDSEYSGELKDAFTTKDPKAIVKAISGPAPVEAEKKDDVFIGIIKVSNTLSPSRDVSYHWTAAPDRKTLVTNMKRSHDNISADKFREYSKATGTPGKIYTSYDKFKAVWEDLGEGRAPSENSVMQHMYDNAW